MLNRFSGWLGPLGVATRDLLWAPSLQLSYPQSQSDRRFGLVIHPAVRHIVNRWRLEAGGWSLKVLVQTDAGLHRVAAHAT